MAQISFTHTDSAQPPGSLPPNIWSLHSLSSENDVVGSPQQLSVFYAGQIYDKLGAFVQATYANDANKMAMDTADVRYANSTTVCEKDLIFGVTVNNNPTVEDVWNSTPAFSFPYASSNFAPTPAAATLIDNTLAATGWRRRALRLLEQHGLRGGHGLPHFGKWNHSAVRGRQPSARRTGGRRRSLLACRPHPSVWFSLVRNRHLRVSRRTYSSAHQRRSHGSFPGCRA